MRHKTIKTGLLVLTMICTLTLGACTKTQTPENINSNTFDDWQSTIAAQQDSVNMTQDASQPSPEQEIDISCSIIN